MASWQQLIDIHPENVTSGRFSVLKNDPLPAGERFRHWYQIFIIATATIAISIGAGIFILKAFQHNHLRLDRLCKESLRTIRRFLNSRWSPSGLKARGMQLPLSPRRSHLPDPRDTSLGLPVTDAKSFCITNSGDLVSCTSHDCALHIISVPEDMILNDIADEAILNEGPSSRAFRTASRSRLSFSQFSAKSKSAIVVMGSMKLATLATFSKRRQAGDGLENAITLLKHYMLYNRLDGIIVQHMPQDSDELTKHTLRQLRQAAIPVFLRANSDEEVLDDLDCGLLEGLILENACVLPDGDRRDFFRAKRVRMCAAVARAQRSTRRGFFLGFLEQWSTCPSAAIVRRAYRLADFFGAAVNARAAVSGPDSIVLESPMSGFDWLKKSEVAWLQKVWSQKTRFTTTGSDEARVFDVDLSQIAHFIPSASRLLANHDVVDVQIPSTLPSSRRSLYATDYEHRAPRRRDIWHFTSCNTSLCTLGSFQLREEISREQYDAVIRIQRSLKERKLLQLYGDAELLRVANSLRTIVDRTKYVEFLKILFEGLADGTIRIFSGLDSGFSLSDGGGSLLAVTEDSLHVDGSRLDIHISKKAPNEAATVWHAYLAHLDVPRLERFQEELLLSGPPNDVAVDGLPTSIATELDQSTECELLYLMQQIRVSDATDNLTSAIMERCRRLLIDETSLHAWISVHSKACLERNFDIKSLLKTRLEYFAHLGTEQLPELELLCEFYNQLQSALHKALLHNDRLKANALTSPILTAYGHAGETGFVTPTADLYGLMFFCALRRLAFENLYLEATDRCPLFLSQSDQAAVFSELWVLGSQCELYFGLLPRALGEIIYDNYRSYLVHNPPPSTAWNGKEVFTAYSMPELDKSYTLATTPPGSASSATPVQHTFGERKRNTGPPKVQQIAREFGALSIFCFPAILDILLLAFLGRGLFLSFWMNDEIKLMADYAILTALVMTGGIVGWIGSTGGFYMYNSAFDNMVHFLVQRFSGAIVLTTAVAVIGFIAFGVENGFFAGFVFLIYLIPLSVFLTLLGIFATMHRSGSPFASGRMAMWKCLPILFISPVMSSFLPGWDFVIYISVIYAFTLVLLLTFRRLCHEWTDWHLKVPAVKEAVMVAWYKEKHHLDSNAGPNSSDMAVLSAAKAALEDEVFKVNFSSWLSFRRPDNLDPFVAKMVAGLPYATFLLKKECGDAELPSSFSTTWFVQLELALNNQRQLMRGLKQHSDFINYRYSRYDIGQNVGLFLAALLDRLIMVTMSARQPEPTELVTDRSRYAVAFALLHFLCGAFAVDSVLQRYWTHTSAASKRQVTGIESLKDILQTDAKQRRNRYWLALSEFMSLLSISFGIWCTLLWLFVSDYQSIVLFFMYICSYTCTLLMQFNRCFTRSHRFHVITVLVCCGIGFTIGCVLRAIPQTADSIYDPAVGQIIATTFAAIGTGILTTYLPLSKSSDLSISNQQESSHSEQSISGSGAGPAAFPSSCEAHAPAPCSATHKAYQQILEHLTLGIDINTTWSTLPESMRRIIVDRVIGAASNVRATYTTLSLPQQQIVAEHDERLIESLADSDDGLLTLVGSRSLACEPPAVSRRTERSKFLHWLVAAVGTLASRIDSIVKWTAIISSAAPDVSRELWYVLRNSPFPTAILRILLKVWKLCNWSRSLCTYHFLLVNKLPLRNLLDILHRGARRSLRAESVIVDTPLWKATGFILRASEEKWGLIIYSGLHEQPPGGQRPSAVAFYNKDHRLFHKQTFRANERIPMETFYYYDSRSLSRWPVSKSTQDSSGEFHTIYDSRGRPVSGEMIRDQARFDFWFEYSSTHSDEVLRATYKSHDNVKMSISVSWCVRPRTGSSDNIEDWIPSEKVQSVLAIIGGQTYEIKWVYKHARRPDIEASMIDKTGKRRPCLAPANVMDDKFGFLQKPQNNSFDHDDLLVYHPASSLRRFTRKSSHNPILRKLSRALRWCGIGEKAVYHKLSSSTLRTALWTSWAKAPYVDAVAASYLDEMIVRKEPLLRKYWKYRDAGMLSEAAHALDENLESVISAIEPSHEASQTCAILIKPADLFLMGLGKDANQLTARLTDAYCDTESSTSVIFSDNGCWPDNPGGVSNCRRDLVNGHTTIRGHCLAESAHDYGIPRFQIERNINTLKVLPLWGLDRTTPYHGLIDNLLQSEVDEKLDATRLQDDIDDVFVPLLQTFIRGARSKRLSTEDLRLYSNTVMAIAKYFERCDYCKTWKSEQVWQAWLTGWLHDYKDPNILNPSEWLEIEQPTLNDFRDALNLYISYFFIFSVEVPQNCPTVFQTTHHGLGSLWGMLLKYRRGTTWGLWDHAILWRETCLNISPAQCLLPLPVQAMLLGGIKLACHLAYTHTDIVLPCTSVFNPEWEQCLGTDDGRRGSKKAFARKIDPIVNGISNMDNFKPVDEVRSKLPTTVMLSNVQFIKDVKNAVLAADIIINEYGFSDYRLIIYGAQDRQPAYALETATLINQRGLTGKVTLAGFGTPKEVLKDAWLFVNSSLSEGLPLAIGEAALSGVPIVATEVGATSLVLTDPDDMTTRYGEVVPPNDPESLARAQISILAMMGPWARYTATDEALPLPDTFSSEDVERITKRMYEKVKDRRALGLRLRDVVLRSFHGHRYLREHEQMFWIQRRRAEIRRSGRKIERHPQISEVFGEQPTFEYQATDLREGETARPRWQNFDLEKVRNRKKNRRSPPDVENGEVG